jgi:hypothetical protein
VSSQDDEMIAAMLDEISNGVFTPDEALARIRGDLDVEDREQELARLRALRDVDTDWLWSTIVDAASAGKA